MLYEVITDEEKFSVARRVAEIVRPLAREVIEVDGVRARFDSYNFV